MRSQIFGITIDKNPVHRELRKFGRFTHERVLIIVKSEENTSKTRKDQQKHACNSGCFERARAFTLVTSKGIYRGRDCEVAKDDERAEPDQGAVHCHRQ